MLKKETRQFSNDRFPHILLTIWYDTVIVRIISNCSKIENVIQKREYFVSCLRESPIVFHAYNQKAKGVDRNNHYVALLKYFRSPARWWHIIFYQFLHISIVNAFIIYKLNFKKHNPTITVNRMVSNIHRKYFILFISRKLLGKMTGYKSLINENLFYIKAQGYNIEEEINKLLQSS